MESKKGLFTLLLLHIFLIGFSQTYQGHIIDQNGDPVAYANIAFLGTSQGTVSDDGGKFSFDVKTDVLSKELVFSCIGYNSASILWNKLQGMNTADLSIQLTKAAYVLPEIEVRPREWVKRKVGNFVKTASIQAGYAENKLGYEAGVKIKIKNKPAYIEKIAIHIVQNEYDTIFYRLNIYDIRRKQVGNNLLPQPIYINLAKEDLKNGLIEIDISQYNIRVDDDFLITLEHVKDLGDGSINFASKLFSRTYYRMTSQADWMSFGMVGISIGCHITQEK